MIGNNNTMDKNRVFSFTVLLTIATLACIVASACGTSNRATDVKRVPWSTAHGKGVLGTLKLDLYAGVQSLVIDADLAGQKTESKVKYDSKQCRSDYCDNCKDVSKAVLGLMVIGAVLTTVSMINQFCRGFGNDSMFQKLMGIAITVAVFAVLLAAMGSFANNCHNKLPSTYLGVDLKKKVGVGLILAVVAAAMQLVILLAHCIVPAPVSTSTFTERLTGRT